MQCILRAMREAIRFSEAQDHVLAATGVLGAETVSVREAEGRVLAEPVVSTRTLPPSDCSAMDGYAVREADLRSASPGGEIGLPVAFEVPAGGVAPRPLAAGEVARIFTGAPMPEGADAVVMQEVVELEGALACFGAPAEPGEHVRRAGEDLGRGDLVLDVGQRIGPAQVGVLASLGRSVVHVHRRPRVALLSGGDELVEPDGDVSGGRIVSSNSYTLAAQAREAGADPLYLGIARDDPAAIEARLRAGLHADVIVSSAGVSVGDHDHVRGVLEGLGCQLEFWGIRMKPGYPVVFGRFPSDGSGAPGPMVFGLPGNPVSASVTFEQFVRPVLLKMQGIRRVHRPTVQAVLTDALDKKPGRVHFVRVRLDREGTSIRATSTGNQSSGVMRSLSDADGLLVFPADSARLEAGALVTVQVIDERALWRGDRGFDA
jgi:molybdopterin molybdotransferase